jgi:hypothetical protein
LKVSVNCHELPPIFAIPPVVFHWYEVKVPAAHLKEGSNVFELWSDSEAMNAWGLAIEPGIAEPSSQVSHDGGKTWRSHHMGYQNAIRGEYLIRLRLEEGQDSPPPAWIPEDPSWETLKSIRERLPAAALAPVPTLDRVKALSTWVASAWEYRSSAVAAQYAPWDLETILAWGKAKKGHNGQVPVVMCVHYGVAFVTACQVAGIAARAAVFTENVTGANGHFTAEVWLPEHNKWIFVDPNMDVLVFKNGSPLSIPEIRPLRPNLSSYLYFGPGFENQKANPVLEPFLAPYANFAWMNHRSIWWRADFLSNPHFSPPGHGALCYCETGLVWEDKDLDDGCAMFPYFGNEAYFETPPQ